MVRVGNRWDVKRGPILHFSFGKNKMFVRKRGGGVRFWGRGSYSGNVKLN